MVTKDIQLLKYYNSIISVYTELMNTWLIMINIIERLVPAK